MEIVTLACTSFAQISMDASSLMKDGKVQFTFGTDKCPEGDTEVTYDRLKTR